MSKYNVSFSGEASRESATLSFSNKVEFLGMDLSAITSWTSTDIPVYPESSKKAVQDLDKHNRILNEAIEKQDKFLPDLGFMLNAKAVFYNEKFAGNEEVSRVAAESLNNASVVIPKSQSEAIKNGVKTLKF